MRRLAAAVKRLEGVDDSLVLLWCSLCFRSLDWESRRKNAPKSPRSDAAARPCLPLLAMMGCASVAALLAAVTLTHVHATVVKSPPPPPPCRSALDCCGSTCSGGVCQCARGYAGASCCALALSECSVAVHPNETWTWGAAPLWTASGGVEVMAMGLRNQCGINNCKRCCCSRRQQRGLSPISHC